VPVDDLLAGEADLIARIKLCYGIDRDSFERDVSWRWCAATPPAYICCRRPPTTTSASPAGSCGSAWRPPFFSLQGTDAHIFSGRMSISARRQLEPRWRHATFIAGLCCELHRLMSHIIVTDAAGEAWPAFLRAAGRLAGDPGQRALFPALAARKRSRRAAWACSPCPMWCRLR
jgi:conjugal transfer pilus assembly protein TraI